MKRFFLNLYSKIRRRLNKVKLPVSKEWEVYKNMSIYEFSKKINSFPYKADLGAGLFDYTASFEHFIDPKVKIGRDCDDFARMWTLWGAYNGYVAHEIILTNPKHFFKDSHVITILEKDGKYILCNYKNYPETDSFIKAIDRMRDWGYYKNGYMYTQYIIFSKGDIK